MDYSTYISAAEKVAALGQKELSKKFLSHASDIVKKKVLEYNFDILVGQVKTFIGAKFVETRVLREKESNTIMFIFKSGINTHRINTTLKNNGEIVWHDGNLFSNRKSVRDFDKLIMILVEYNRDIQKLMKEMNITEIKIISRTFYI